MKRRFQAGQRKARPENDEQKVKYAGQKNPSCVLHVFVKSVPGLV